MTFSPSTTPSSGEATLQAAEANVLEHLDLEYLLGVVEDLVAVPSLGGTAEENLAQELVAERLADLGAEVDLWEIDLGRLARHPRYCAEIERTRALGLVGSWGGSGGRHLVLNGHVDVVPLGDRSLWTVEPWRVTRRKGRLYGRGTCDMKGALACALTVAKAIRDAGVDLRGRLSIHSAVGEEDGGCGTLGILERGHRGDGAIVMEPTRLAVAPAQAGAINFRLVVEGRSAHACVREEGHSAVEAFLPIFAGLKELESRRNARRTPFFEDYDLPWALSVGTVRAGDWPSSVPDRLVAEGRLGVAVGESLKNARHEFEAAVREAADADPWLRDRPPRIEWWGGQFEPAACPVDAAVVSTLQGAVRSVSGAAPRLEGMTFRADMRLLSLEAGIPTVLFGPGDIRRAHTPDEWIEEEGLHRAASILAVTALRFCGFASKA